MRKLIVSLIAVAVLAVQSLTAAEVERPVVQLAILLDTSNSMDGLINQAKAQLWKVVNECAALKKDGQRPVLYVALYEYGNNGLPRAQGYIRQVLPLTTDLDKVSEQLFALRTNGGQEYCGQVIQQAVDELKWSDSNKDLKLIFIAGNEPFTQGSVDYRKSCKAAITKGIMVNTIHCGSYDEGVRGMWADGAKLADGKYLIIDQNQKVVNIPAPQDKKIMELGRRLNETYIYYGARGREGKARQEKQDANAAAMAPGSAVQRAVAKSSTAYQNAGWDLADAVQNKKVEVEKLKEEQLPEQMRKMTPEERKAYVAKMLAEREKLQKEVKQLNAEREKYVGAKRRALAEKGEDTLDAAMIKSIRTQAKARSFETEK